MELKKVVVVGGQRIPFVKSMTSYMTIGNRELMTAAMRAVVEKYNLKDKDVGEVVLGAVMKHSSDWNMAREVTLSSGLSPRTPAYDIQQACGTSLDASILIANKIALGQIDCGIAGGTDTNSDLPFVFPQSFGHKMLDAHRARTSGERFKAFLKIRPSDLKPIAPAVIEPRTGLSMGQSCELMVQQWGVTREEQDALAYASHQNAAKAYEEGFYADLIVPFNGVKADSNVRADTSMEKLAKLKPAFERSEKGTLTAGNSSPLTDGAAAVVLASEEYAKAQGWPILAELTFSQVAAVDFVKDEGLLMAPAYAVPKMLKRAGLKLQDFDFYEIHEAFAGQVLCTLKAWENEKFCKEKLGLDAPLGSIDRSKLNVKGGSVAIGHPFAATGARIVSGLAKMLHQKGSGRGLISICTAGGMGVTAIIEKK